MSTAMGVLAGPAVAQQPAEADALPPVVVETTPAKSAKKAATKAKPKQAPPAAAQPVSAPAPQEDGPGVGAETGKGPVNGIVARQSVTGTKTDTPLIETPRSINVVSREQLDAQAPTSVEDALRYTPGVIGGHQGPDPRSEWMKIRGFSAVMFLDGLKFPEGANQFGGYKPELYGLERVEVLKGPGSGVYGQTTPGGMINLVSKRPTEFSFAEIEGQVGSFDRRQGAFDFGGPVTTDGSLLYRMTGLVREGDTQTDYVHDDRLFLAPSLTWRNASTSLTLLGRYQKDDAGGTTWGLPASGTLLPNPNGRIPIDFFVGDPNFDFFKGEHYSIGYEFAHQFDSVWSFRQNLRYEKSHNEVAISMALGYLPDERTLLRSGAGYDTRVDPFLVDNQLQADFSTGFARHKLLFGLDYRLEGNTLDFQMAGLAPPIDVFDPVYGLPYPPLATFQLTEQDSSQLGLYVQDQIKLDRWVLNIGGRHDWAETETTTNGGALPDTKDEAFTYNAGLLYLFDSGFAPYVSYATSFLPTAGLGAGRRPFEPREGEQYEIGLKYQPPGQRALFTVSAFDLTETNSLTVDPVNICDGIPCQAQIGEAQSRGIELEGKTSLAFGLDLIASYAYTETEITKSGISEEVGNWIPLVPRHQAALWADYTFQDGTFAGLGIGAGVRYMSSYFGDPGNVYKLPSVTFVDAAIRYDFGALDPSLEGYTAALNVSNLFGEEYLATCYSAVGCIYGADRTALFTLKYRWE